MKVTPLAIPDFLLPEPQVFGGDRGLFFERNNISTRLMSSLNTFLCDVRAACKFNSRFDSKALLHYCARHQSTACKNITMTTLTISARGQVTFRKNEDFS